MKSLITEIDELYEKGTAEEWECPEEVPGSIAAYDEHFKQVVNLVMADIDGYFTLSHHPDAHLIVALRNNWPKVSAALKAAAFLGDWMKAHLEAPEIECGGDPEDCDHCDGEARLRIFRTALQEMGGKDE